LQEYEHSSNLKKASRVCLHSFQIELWRDASVLKPRRFGAATLLQMAYCARTALEGFKGLAGQTLTRRLLAQLVSNSCCLLRSSKSMRALTAPLHYVSA